MIDITEKYNPSHITKFIGATGMKHKSAAEAKASFQLLQTGWIPCETTFSQVFYDSEGTAYRAQPDFYHPATGFYAEFKCRRMNGKGSKRAADAAMARVDANISLGYTIPAYRAFKALDNAWNHSVETMACKSKQLPSDKPLVLIYEKEQDRKEEMRCQRKGIFMLSLKNMKTFNGFLKFASLGLNVEFSRADFHYGVMPA